MNYYKPDSLKQQKFIVSKFWSLEVGNPSVSGTMFPLKPVGENPVLPYVWW